jgi:hypothetical protein
MVLAGIQVRAILSIPVSPVIQRRTTWRGLTLTAFHVMTATFVLCTMPVWTVFAKACKTTVTMETFVQPTTAYRILEAAFTPLIENPVMTVTRAQ